MTTPQHLPDAEGRLRVLAAWEPDSVRSAVGVLADVADGWRARRTRLDELGRSLGTADCWSGPAADAAAATAVELSAVATAVGSALALSQEGFAALTEHARRAQALAEQALVAELLGRPDPARTAAALVPDLVPAPPPGPAEEALAAAHSAAVAAGRRSRQ